MTEANGRSHAAPVRAMDASVRSDAVLASAWESLVHDTDQCVAVVDADCRVQFANACAASSMGTDPAHAVGRGLFEGMSPEFVEERSAVLRRSLTTGAPLVIDGIVGGVMKRCTVRPIPGPGGRCERALVVSRPLHVENGDLPPAAHAVVRARVDDLGNLSQLTAREIEILGLIGKGLTTAEIANQLRRSVKTVEWHRVSLGDKLGAGNRVELARIAIRAGL